GFHNFPGPPTPCVPHSGRQFHRRHGWGSTISGWATDTNFSGPPTPWVPHSGRQFHRRHGWGSKTVRATITLVPSRLKRYHTFGHDHFITFSCYQRLPLLNNDRARIAFEETF